MDVERTIQFILDALARLEAVSGQHEERLTRIEASVAGLTAQVAGVTDLVGRLAPAELRLVERMDSLAGRMDALADSQAHRDRRLDALIAVVDRLSRQ